MNGILLPSAYLNKLKELFASKSHGTHVSSSTCVTGIAVNNGSTQTGNVSLTIPTIPSTPAEVGACGFPDYLHKEDVLVDFKNQYSHGGENSYTASANGWLDYRISTGCALYLKYPGSTTSVKIDSATSDHTTSGTIFIKAGDTIISNGLALLEFIPTR